METIESINSQLQDLYGIDTLLGIPIWKVAWSDTQLEKRKTNVTESGIQLLHPQVMEVKKYPYIRERFILERLVIVPEVHEDELTTKVSYEPIFVFTSKENKFLHPTMLACKFVVDTVYAALGKSNLRKYTESELHTTEEGRVERVKELENQLFGDESGLQGKTHLTKEAIVVPNSYEGEKK